MFARPPRYFLALTWLFIGHTAHFIDYHNVDPEGTTAAADRHPNGGLLMPEYIGTLTLKDAKIFRENPVYQRRLIEEVTVETKANLERCS